VFIGDGELTEEDIDAIEMQEAEDLQAELEEAESLEENC